MKQLPSFEFHISRQARDRYQFDLSLFSLSGNVVFANFHATRLFAQKMNQKRDLLRFPEQAVRAGQINAMGLIDEILHFVVGIFRQEKNPQAMADALERLDERLGADAVDNTLSHFVQEFPPMAVYRDHISALEYLQGQTGGVPNRQIALEELLLLWLANANPAFSPYLELFDASSLEKETAYPAILAELHDFFETQPHFGPDGENLIDFLRSPAIAVPHSLTGQLEYIRQRWTFLLGKYLFRLLSSLDLIQEEEKAIFLGPGPARVYDFSGMQLEAERFSPDKEWMPSLVLIAKNAYVWLDQLSKKYGQPIHLLDQIPGEELDNLARAGFSGLWLIGLWERSQASQRIKQLRGNPEAVASAYSLFDYQIASDLGGEEAYQRLREQAWQRGIRLASDMVPNHMGIDSRWVIEHPDWFISLDYSPFPSYSFNGVDLSWDERVGIYIEDHYFDNTDASVVFKRLDRWSGDTRYLYHGNDGTSMPWNDTAQLNYLLPEVREAVIQTILHVARKFPIIRFDAAMTLAKKHYQRLWFPEPGSGGAIPTRAEHGLTREQFDAAFPVEFWREVVDRVAQEVPDTLLLAEAFWLMEGYFVRTLGMHRVYNSAFMNMLRDEKNQEYRLTIKNTLEFDPEILKRYVNFMNNPDERTAVDQFGKGDKYFGICTLMATMPGLPMFGHGQVEGLTEKYGMEFRRAYWDEKPDPYLVERHEREIFPLLRKRHLFADVGDFLLYDFYTSSGQVNEDVFAYSNRSGAERSLVVYHNRYAETSGWIRTSAAYSVKGARDGRALVQKSLGEGLGLQNAADRFVIFRDMVTDLEYIRNNSEIYEQGLYATLGAYKYHVFLDFQEVQDNEWHQYAQLAGYLNGRGVPSISETLRELFLQPVHYPFRELVNPGMLGWLLENREFPTEREAMRSDEKSGSPEEAISRTPPATLEQALAEVEQKSLHLLRETALLTQSGLNGKQLSILAGITRQDTTAILSLPAESALDPDLSMDLFPAALQLDKKVPARESAAAWGSLLCWAFTRRLGAVLGEEHAVERSRSWIDEWLLGKIIAGSLQEMGMEESSAWRAVNLIRILVQHQDWANPAHETPGGGSQAALVLQSWLQDGEVQRFLGINRYGQILWFNQESFEDLLGWMYAIAAIQIKARAASTPQDSERHLQELTGVIRRLHQAIDASGYQVEKLLQKAGESS